MNILIEGPDGAGKSTLAEAIARRWFWEQKQFAYKHITSQDNVESNVDYLLGLLLRNDNNIFDRGHLSNVVYESVFGDGQPTLSNGSMKAFDRMFDLIIIALPTPKELYLAKFEELRGIRPEKYDNMDKVYDGFQGLIEKATSCNIKKVIHYDYTKYDLFGFLNTIL